MTDFPSTVLDAALWMAREFGAYVFEVDHPDSPACTGLDHRYVDPARCPSRGKHTCVRYTLDATSAEREILARFAGATRNYGVYTRQSRLLVLDEDVPGTLDTFVAAAGEALPETFEVTRGTGGRRHLYFRVPLSSHVGNADLCPGVNVRAGADGYVVGPGSTHVSGDVYVATWDRRPAQAPAWLVDFLAAKRADETRSAVKGEALDRPLPARIMELLTEPPQDRSERFHRIAGDLYDGGFSQGQAVTVLEPWCAETGKYVGRVAGEVARSWSKVGGKATNRSPDPLDMTSAARAIGIDAAEAVFTRWLGKEYDLGALDVVLAAAAVEQLGGDPPWVLVVSGSGNAKTETVVALAGAGAHIVSTISSEGALLSATPGKERSKDATGGLLRKVGPRGLVVIKDFTSILSMNRDMRAAVLAALREVYDGRWDRNVGTDGGKTLTWAGRIVVIGAVTTKYDAAHSVIAAMGDRFCLVRVDSTTGRRSAGRQALSNVDHEVAMRAELAEVVGALLAGVDPARAMLAENDQETLLDLADLVTLGRTAVERDYKGDVIDAHAPEMPTRFAKMLGQILRGGLALGMSPARALDAAVRAAGDSMPPLRLAILGDLAGHPGSRTGDVQRRLQRPRSTVDRELQALHILGLLVVDEDTTGGWRYLLADTVDEAVLAVLVTRNVSKGEGPEGSPLKPQNSGTDKSGDRRAA